MHIPDLRARNDEIYLDQISILVEYIHKAFSAAYGESPDVNEWNAVGILEEMNTLFKVDAFNSLFATEFGKGVIVGAWVQEYILSRHKPGDENGEDDIMFGEDMGEV